MEKMESNINESMRNNRYKINYEAMRIKIEFLFKILTQMNMGANYGEDFGDTFGLSSEDWQSCKNCVATIALNLIYINRSDEGTLLSRSESINARGISQVIADEFIKLSEEINNEVQSVVMPHMKHLRYEIVLHAGLDKIMELLKDLLEPKGKEANNG